MADDMLDPIGYAGKAEKSLAPRLASLHGTTLALVDIGFPNGNIFLDRVVVAGGTAGRFSVAIPGWVADDLGQRWRRAVEL